MAKAGLDDITGLFQPLGFYDSISNIFKPMLGSPKRLKKMQMTLYSKTNMLCQVSTK